MEQLSPNIIKIKAHSNVYLIERSIIIDTSAQEFKQNIKEEIKKIVPLENIKTVIFTHLHYDHISNFDLFPNAQFFAHNINLLSKDKQSLILDPAIADKFSITPKEILDDKYVNSLFQIFPTPGHCPTAICLYYTKDNILLTGDTYFNEFSAGRTDLPLSEPEKMPKSILLIKGLIKKHNPIIAPGHDY